MGVYLSTRLIGMSFLNGLLMLISVGRSTREYTVLGYLLVMTKSASMLSGKRLNGTLLD